MSPTSNGLGVMRNGVLSASNTDPIPGGRLWPEAALTWNTMRADYIADGGHPDEFMPAGPRSSARTLEEQRTFWAAQPPPAAVPGTSNHGWGVAVDVKTRRAAAWMLVYAGRYGWSWGEGRRVGEWWHWTYVGAPRALLRRLQSDPLEGYTAAETRWIREYDRSPSTERRRVLRRVMTEQRKRIWREAQRTGWTRNRRKDRYNSLKART